MRWKYVLPVVASVGLGVVWKFIQQRNAKAAYAHDTTPMFSPGLHHFVSVLQVQHEGPQQGAPPVISGLGQIAEKHGGHLTYLGQCVDVYVQTSQLVLPTCDVVAQTTWRHAAGFEAFRAEINDSFAIHKVQALNRITPINIVVAVLFHGLLPLALQAKAALFGAEWSDLSVQSTQPDQTEGAKTNAMGISQYEEWKSLHQYGDILDAGDPEQPVVVWNFEVPVDHHPQL